MNSYVPEYLKVSNRKVIFDLFRQHRELSRADAVSLSSMSFPTASKNIDYFISRGIVEETDRTDERQTGPGRKRKTLVFRPERLKTLGLVFEGQVVDIGIIDCCNKVYHHECREFRDFTDSEAQKDLGRHVASLIAKTEGVIGVGIAIPTNIDTRTGEIIGYYSIGLEEPKRFCELFSDFLECIDLPYFVENDVNLAALGELCIRQRGEAVKNLCYLSLGTGFGSGLIINGELWQGSHFGAGEVGNMTLTPIASGKLGYIPLENEISISRIREEFKVDLLHETELDDKLVAAIIRYILPVMTASIFNISIFLDLDTFILGGIVPKVLGVGLVRSLEEALNGKMESRNRRVRILPPSSPDIAMVGASKIVFDKLLEQEFDRD